jgi:NAD(P)-dependent dehydrogenase (short-subunit alcohol dehydrogenase family)
MQGKTVVITGGTSGIGEVAAVALARAGARLVLVARSPSRAEPVLARLKLANPDAVPAVHYADLSRLAEMKRVAAEIAAAEPRIDVLVNNAGALFGRREVTADGLELTFALNHMAYFVITAGLIGRLKPGARIVSTASNAHLAGKLNFDDLQAEKGYSGFRVYGTSKLCNILFTRELARRLEDTGVSANCLHPGFVDTRFASGSGGVLGGAFAFLKALFAISPEAGARTIVHLAVSPEVEGQSGGYWYKCKPIAPSAAAQNDEDARRLWQISETIAHG